MKMGSRAQRSGLFGAAAFALFGFSTAQAASGTWTGTESTAWTNNANWTSSTYPGNGTQQTATFNSGGNGNTTLDLAGLPSIRYLVFTNEAAAYTLGTGGANAQPMVWEGAGQITVDGTVAATQRVDAAVQVGSTVAASTHTFRNDSLTHPLVLAGNLAGATGTGTKGTKTMYVRGAGDTFIGGDISAGDTLAMKLITYCTGTLTLAGVNTFDSDMEFYSGTLRLTHPQAFGGSARIIVRSPPPEGGFIEFAHEGDVAVPFNLAIGNYNGAWNIATIVSGVGPGSGGVGRNYTIGEVGISGTSLAFERSAEVTSGTPSITIQKIDMNGSGPVCTFIPKTADLHVGDVTISAQNYAKTLVLDGTSAGSRVDGVISNGIHTISVVKSNSGTWTLAGANVYTGATSVAGGTLAVAGEAGTLKDTRRISVASGGTFLLDNTSAANSDRLNGATPIALEGGIFSFLPATGAADTHEAAGDLVIVSGGTVASGRADAGGTSSITFASLVYEGGTVDFTGEGLGEDGRTQILFATPPPLSGGIIGPWATVNGTALATYGPNGITAYVPGATTDIAARGPGSVIPDDADAHVRIVDDGMDGPITLADDDTGVASLTQANPDYAATVDTAGKTLRAAVVAVEDGAAALTVGAAAGDGTLTAAAPGGVLTLANASGQPLTLRAALADNGAASPVSIMGGGTIVLAGAVTHTGPTAINGGELVFAGHEVAQTVASAIGGTGAVVKTGTNLLYLVAANTYTGDTTINAGIVRASTSQAFGSTTEGDVSVADGATLDIGGSDIQDAIDFGTQRFTVSGAGVDGQGVIVNNSNTRQLNAFGRIALAGDSVFGGTREWRIRNNEPLLEMNGFKLTKKGTNVVDLYSATVLPGAGHFEVAEGTLNLLYDTRLNGSAANTVTVRNGATLQFHNFLQAAAPVWTLLCDDGAILRVAGGTDGYNEWAGPVVLGGGVTLTAQGAFHQRFSGEISGAGPVTKISSATSYLLGTNSTYAGQTRITAGRIAARSLRNVGEPSSLGQPLNASDGAIVIGSGSTSGMLEYIGEGDTTDRAITMGGTTGAAVIYQNGTGPLKFVSGLEAAASGAKPLLFRGDAVAGGEFAGNIPNAGGNVIRVNKEETGTWVLSGSNTFTGPLTVNGGTLVLAGPNVLGGPITNVAGTLRLTGSLNQGAANCFIAWTTTANGILRLSEGANMTGTGNFSVGRNNGYCGAFYMDGGTFIRDTATSDGERFCFGYSAGGYGYLKVDAGVLRSPRLQLGPNSGTGVGYGVARITGGTVITEAAVHISRGGNSIGVLTVQGGVYEHTNANVSTFIHMGYDGGRGELNLTGGKLELGGQLIEMRRSSGNPTNSINLCAGYLALNYITNRAPGVGWVNFCGGTLKAGTANNQAFIPSTITGVYTYGPFGAFAGGAVIDSNGRNVTIPKAIEAPAGNGVYAVTLSEMGSGYVGEPYVSIRGGGGGAGACAVADMEDDGTGNGTYRVAGVTITSPGFGYTEPPEVTFLRGGNNISTATVATVTLAPNASGGLTKTGAGTLTLSAANTYTGVTTIADGTLKLANAKALPTQTAVALAGGTLDLSGYTVTNTISGSGVLTNGTVQAVISPAGAGVIGADTLTLDAAVLAGTYLADVAADGTSDHVAVQGNIDLAGLTLQLVDPGLLNRSKAYTLLTCSGTRSGKMSAANLPDTRWRVANQSDGSVRLVFVDGLMISVK